MIKTITRFMLLCGAPLALLAGCTKTVESPPGGDVRYHPMTFRIGTAVVAAGRAAPAAVQTEFFTSVDALHFVGGTLDKVAAGISVTNGECIVEAVPGSTVCFMANVAGAPSVTVGRTTLAEFRSLCVEQLSAESDYRPAEFLSGDCVVPEVPAAPVGVALWRSVAQLNLDTSSDENLAVERIEVEGLALNTTLMRAETPAAVDRTRTLTLDWSSSPKTTEENVLRLYESAEAVRFTVHALYRGQPQVVRLALPAVRRNYFYTIRLSKVESAVTGSFTVVPWQDGGDVGAAPDDSQAIVLDESRSVFPEGVVSAGQNRLGVWERGGDITLAFAADAEVEARMEGEGQEAALTPLGAETAGDKVVSRFRLNIREQGRGRLGYLIGLNVKRKTHLYSYDRFSVEVAPSSSQIETVTLGGVEWMAFNSVSDKLEDQIYPLDGLTVEEMYRTAWHTTVGSLFQFGRMYAYSPCKPGKHNAGNQVADGKLYWLQKTHVPCPEGYRVPTKEEMRALLPPGTPIPGTYDCNGETVAATLHDAEPSDVTIDGISGKARYLRLSSSVGGVMYIPLSGKKGDKSTAASPNLGQGFALWTNRYGDVGGYAYIGHFWPGSASEGMIPNNAAERLQQEAYAYLRCVRE